MAQVKLLKIDSTYGIPLEFDSALDDITLLSYTVTGGGPVLSGTGLDLNNQDISDIKNVAFNTSSTATIGVNGTTYIADDWMFQTKNNVMTTAGGVLFPVVTDVAGEVDAFRLPALAGAPTASPTSGGEGYLVWDSTNNALYAWNGTAWDNLNTVTSAEHIDDIYTAGETLVATDAVYISAADTVSKAECDVATSSYLIGFATAGAASAAPVTVRKNGYLGGFSTLTAGARYYLSATAGAITSTLPVGTGNVIVQAGYAKNTTTLDIQILQLGRRAI
jgi:hypothetical protein